MELATRRAQELDGAWYWQGDGQDVPESLSCPVLMAPDVLRQLLAAAQGGAP